MAQRLANPVRRTVSQKDFILLRFQGYKPRFESKVTPERDGG